MKKSYFYHHALFLFVLVLDNIISVKQILYKQCDNDISKRQVFRLSTQEKVLKNDSEEKRRAFLFLLGLYDCKKWKWNESEMAPLYYGFTMELKWNVANITETLWLCIARVTEWNMPSSLPVLRPLSWLPYVFPNMAYWEQFIYFFHISRCSRRRGQAMCLLFLWHMRACALFHKRVYLVFTLSQPSLCSTGDSWLKCYIFRTGLSRVPFSTVSP